VVTVPFSGFWAKIPDTIRQVAIVSSGFFMVFLFDEITLLQNQKK
jgi:hypothetical protein